jgi:hypothetical protein
VLVGAGLVARWLPEPDPASTEIAGAREVTAYELVSGETLSFALPPGATEVRVLSNLDLSPDAPAAGVPYAVRVRVPEDGRDATFPLVALPAVDAAGGRTAFFLGRTERPARPRMLSLVRGSSLPATLDITLPTPAAGRASLRVLVAHAQLAARPPAPRGPPLLGLAPEDLAPEARAALESRTWSRLPTREKAATRGFYVVGGPPPPPAPRPAGQAVGDGHVAAFTLTGPGTVHLETPDGLSGEAALLDRDGIIRVEPLALGPGGRISLALGSGLTTVRVTARRAARVRLVGEPRLAAKSEQRSDADASGEVELGPAWSWQALSLAGPDGPPVELAAGGRGEAGLRITARVPLGSAGASPDRELRWRFVDGRGAVLQQGKLPVTAQTAPEDRLDGPEPFVSVPTTAFLWAPLGAVRLLLDAPRAVLVSASSPALESALAPSDELGIDRALVLRYRDSGAFEAVQPLNQVELRRLGRQLRFAGAMRLESRPLPPAPAQATSLDPERGGAQFVLLAPLEEAPRGEHREGLSFAVRPAHDETVLLARPRGASARARVAATLYYEVERVRGRGSVAVSLDGQVVRRASVLGRRGQLVLPPVAVGRHRLRVELPAGGRAFIDQPVVGAAAFRRSRVFTLQRGSALVHLPKGGAARSLGVVLYADGPEPPGAALEAVVDGGRRVRRSGGASRDYTRLRRRSPLSFRKVEGARYLNRAQPGVWASQPVFIPLGDDLRAGGHSIALRAVGLGGAPLARFFSYGGPVASRISQHLELRAEDGE